MKSRMKGDFHVWFRENAGVKFPCVARFIGHGRRPHNRQSVNQKKIPESQNFEHFFLKFIEQCRQTIY